MEILHLYIVFLALILLTTIPTALGCSCKLRSLRDYYFSKQITSVLHVRVNSVERGPSSIIHHVSVLKSFKGCTFDDDDDIKIRSPINSCMISLEAGVEYLVTANTQDCRAGGNKKALYIISCGYNRKWDTLNENDIQFLFTRTVCCGSDCECAGGPALPPCPGDPCDFNSCEERSICVRNFCGGCFAEFFISDERERPICTRCEDDFDCSYDQKCVSGECRTDCQSFGSCPLGFECRDDGLCYSGLKLYKTCGDPVCTGYTPKDLYDRCSIDVQDMIGEPCEDENFLCDPQDSCNALVVCAETDPKTLGCPKSRRHYKRDIQYIDTASKHAERILSMKLATYTDDAGSNVYIEEDDNSSFLVGEDGLISGPSLIDESKSPLDLYKYVSMTVATIQNQEKDLASLRDSVQELKLRLEKGRMNG